MTDLHIPDLSEFQTSVDFAALAKAAPAAILRAHNGYRADHTFAARLPQVRAHMTVRLFYGFCVADRDPVVQARELAALVGPLQPGEGFVCDYETSHGADDAQRAKNYLGALTGRDVLYSGDSFYHAHLTSAQSKGLLLWDAAYSDNEPNTAHFLWQHTDHQTFPGVSSACDCSVYHGTVQSLSALLTPGAPHPAPAPVAKPYSYPRVLRLAAPMMHGADVQHLQTRLGVVGSAADGVFGPHTKALLARRQHGLALPATGVLDSKSAVRIG